jgi:hypothetical protein
MMFYVSLHSANPTGSNFWERQHGARLMPRLTQPLLSESTRSSGGGSLEPKFCLRALGGLGSPARWRRQRRRPRRGSCLPVARDRASPRSYNPWFAAHARQGHRAPDAARNFEAVLASVKQSRQMLLPHHRTYEPGTSKEEQDALMDETLAIYNRVLEQLPVLIRRMRMRVVEE